ncbi:DNA polymerase III subunit delta' [Picosynechococcus sp. PCC 11901]|uniref:DNA polymerase III subunit delta' n=1 Tax=Picosynechococcus sp. PCC 11901 TaxID=2579791 RepID=UPI0010FC2EBA|nr:DNA polymerase III subunit delta' [Picosynechococcus sp. PCC 11901]QCS49828.1 DNA polymerase III subunit delta' [Picosynechococcus sp. PCC 11901]
MISLDQVLGQPQAVSLLRQAIAQDRLAPAYLFAGPEGIGRSLTARGFTTALMTQEVPEAAQRLIRYKLLKNNHPDLLWVEPTYQHQGKLYTPAQAQEAGLKRKAPPQIRIEQIRQLGEFLSRPALEAPRCVVVIEAAQTMAEAPANALLKTLEEPGNATLILLAPSGDSLLPTLISRCQKIPFYRLSQDNVAQILTAQGYQHILADETILAIAQGSPGAAIQIYELLSNVPQDLLQSLQQLPQNPLGAFSLAKEIHNALDIEVQLQLIDYLQYQYWQRFHNDQLIQSLETTRKYLRNYVQPRLVWETFFLEFCQTSP